MTDPPAAPSGNPDWAPIPGVVDLDLQRAAWARCPACGDRATRVIHQHASRPGEYRADCPCGHTRHLTR